MRLVIDLQVAQGDDRDTAIGRFYIDLVRDLACVGSAHEIFVALNSNFAESIEPIRADLAGLVPAEKIIIWHSLKSVAAREPKNASRQISAEAVRETALAGLSPDVILLLSAFLGFDDDMVTSIGQLPSSVPTIALFADVAPPPYQDSSAVGSTMVRWYQNKLGHLRRAELLVAISEAAQRQAACELPGVPVILALPDGERVPREDAPLPAPRALLGSAVARAIWFAVDTRVSTPASWPTRLSSVVLRPRLAYVFAYQSGTRLNRSTTSAISELSRFYKIDLVSTANAVAIPELLGNCAVRDLEWFRCHAAEYDRIVYQIGGSWIDSRTVDLLHTYAGLVILQDFDLSKLALHRDEIGETSNGMVRGIVEAQGWAAATRYLGAERFREDRCYPCNLAVLQDALGIVVHRNHDRQRAVQFYGEGAADEWAVVPLPCRPLMLPDRRSARQVLGIAESEFIVCSFATEKSARYDDRLLEAWQMSPLAHDARCRLVFVCGRDEGADSSHLERAIRLSGADRVEISRDSGSGAVCNWLAATDLGVQLSEHAGCEDDAVTLDWMNAEVPMIANSGRGVNDLPEDCVWLLPNDFGNVDLASALAALWIDYDKLLAVAARAKARIQSHNDARACAGAYVAALEQCYDRAAIREDGIGRALIEADVSLSNSEWAELARAISRNVPPRPRLRRLFVDVSELVHRDSRSGIQRVVRSILMQWLREPPEGILVEPVYAGIDGLGYRHARTFTAKFLGLPGIWYDHPIEPTDVDIFIGLDLQSDIVPRHRAVLEDWYRSGTQVYFVLYDLLPVTLPDYFVEGTKAGHLKWLEVISQFTGVVCISRAVADDFTAWLDQNGPVRASGLSVGWFHLGADTESSVPSTGLPSDAPTVLSALRATSSFLAVGTIEPRKGHRQLLAGFESLWSSGHAVNLVLVGQLGWMMDDFAREVRESQHYGVRLFWLEAISDEYLDAIYRSCSCLIAASEGEGFGLPLIEASRHGLPVLARDIPVFREVGRDAVRYFADVQDPSAIRNAVIRFLDELAEGVQTGIIESLTWKQSAEALLESILGEKPGYRTWTREQVAHRKPT